VKTENVLLQVLVSEKFQKELRIRVVRGVEPAKPLLNV
jgi:hypothetical protein